MGEKSRSSETINIIRSRISKNRYRRLVHFNQRMDERGLFWADVMAVIDEPSQVVDDGVDEFGRERWLISGLTTDELSIKLVTVLDFDAKGQMVVLITLFHEESS